MHVFVFIQQPEIVDHFFSESSDNVKLVNVTLRSALHLVRVSNSYCTKADLWDFQRCVRVRGGGGGGGGGIQMKEPFVGMVLWKNRTPKEEHLNPIQTRLLLVWFTIIVNF